MAAWTEFLEPDEGEDRFLSWPKVRAIADISRSTAWRLQNAGEFPLPVVLSPGRVGWSEREVTAWKRSRSPRRSQEHRPFPPRLTPSDRLISAKPARRQPNTVPKPDAPPVVPSPELHPTSPVVRLQPAKPSRKIRQEAVGQTAFEF